jgi:hypothetical protein
MQTSAGIAGDITTGGLSGQGAADAIADRIPAKTSAFADRGARGNAAPDMCRTSASLFNSAPSVSLTPTKIVYNIF